MIADDLLAKLTGLLRDPDRPVPCADPAALEAAVDFSLDDEGQGRAALDGIVTHLLRYTPNVSFPTYLNYFYGAPDPVGLVGDWAAAAVNTNVHAYEASPFFTLAEVAVVRELARVLGWDSTSDGIFCPGGSYSNMLGVYLSRIRAFPESIRNGMAGEGRPVIFVSEQAHYSFDRTAALMGLGTDAVIKVRCDARGRMRPQDLKQRIDKAIESGEIPFMVCATLGTTVLGAFDPLPEIRTVLADYPGIRLHADAAWGGAVFMSDEFKRLGQGIEMADSVTWDFHKALGAPILCSVLLVRDGSDLKNIFTDDTSYIFHGDDPEGSLDLGRKTPQCGRRADAFKLWLMWKINGKHHFRKEVEKRFRIKGQILEAIRARDCLCLYDEAPDYWNIGFWYLPQALRNQTCTFSLSEQEEISHLTARISQDLKKEGRVHINYAQVQGAPAFFRLVINNSRLDQAGIAMVLDRIAECGRALAP